MVATSQEETEAVARGSNRADKIKTVNKAMVAAIKATEVAEAINLTVLKTNLEVVQTSRAEAISRTKAATRGTATVRRTQATGIIILTASVDKIPINDQITTPAKKAEIINNRILN
mgnify:FL=1